MTSPLKPWETAPAPAAGGIIPGAGLPGQPGGRGAPPVPRRPRQVGRSRYPMSSTLPSTYDGLGGYGGLGYGSYGGLSTYGGLGYGGFGGLGGYNRLGGYGSPFGAYSYSPMMSRLGWQRPDDTTAFARSAEQDSSQQAFQSIASAVQAFSAVALMLDSTFYAVYNSFRAVLGVAVHFSQLKTQILQGMSSSAILRLVQRALRLFNRLLVWFKLRKPGPETVWQDVGGESFDAAKQASRPRGAGSWPILIYLAVALGAPWLIWTMLRGAETNEVTTSEWATGQGPHFVAQALYDFIAENNQELSIQAGNMLFIAPQELQPRVRGWLLAAYDGQEGLVPMNYVQLVQNTAPSSNPSVDPNSAPGVTAQSAASIAHPPANVNPMMSGADLAAAWDSGLPSRLNPTAAPWEGPRAASSLLPQHTIPQSALQRSLHQGAPQTIGLPSWQLQNSNQAMASGPSQPVCESKSSVQKLADIQPVANTVQPGSVTSDLKTLAAVGGLQPSSVVHNVTEQSPAVDRIVGNHDNGLTGGHSMLQTEQTLDNNEHKNTGSSHHSNSDSGDGSS